MPDDLATEYRQQADDCRLQAERSIKSEDKAQWLRLAAAWQELAEKLIQNWPILSLVKKDKDASGS